MLLLPTDKVLGVASFCPSISVTTLFLHTVKNIGPHAHCSSQMPALQVFDFFSAPKCHSVSLGVYVSLLHVLLATITFLHFNLCVVYTYC